MRRALAISLVLTSACYPQPKFAADAGEAICQLYADCEVLDLYDFASQDDCVAEVTAANDKDAETCAEYDRKAAQDCVNDVNAMSCADAYEGSLPQTCATACGS